MVLPQSSSQLCVGSGRLRFWYPLHACGVGRGGGTNPGMGQDTAPRVCGSGQLYLSQSHYKVKFNLAFLWLPLNLGQRAPEGSAPPLQDALVLGVGKRGAAQHHCPPTSGIRQKTCHVTREICLEDAGSLPPRHFLAFLLYSL